MTEASLPISSCGYSAPSLARAAVGGSRCAAAARWSIGARWPRRSRWPRDAERAMTITRTLVGTIGPRHSDVRLVLRARRPIGPRSPAPAGLFFELVLTGQQNVTRPTADQESPPAPRYAHDGQPDPNRTSSTRASSPSRPPGPPQRRGCVDQPCRRPRSTLRRCRHCTSRSLSIGVARRGSLPDVAAQHLPRQDGPGADQVLEQLELAPGSSTVLSPATRRDTRSSSRSATFSRSAS